MRIGGARLAVPGLWAVAALIGCGSSGGSTTNHAPDGVITSPSGNVNLAVGESVTFQGSCTDPDGDAVSHAWTFDGAASASTAQSPGNVTFSSAGTFLVTYTCTDAKGLADPSPDTRSITVIAGTIGTYTRGGTLTFDKVRSTASGLDYAQTTQRPLRGVDVAVVDAANTSTVLASGVTDNSGVYSLGWTGTSAVKLVVFARMHTPKISVLDNTSNGAVWAIASPTLDATNLSTASFNVPSGWNGSSYSARSSAPFAVLDAATEAVLAFLAVRPAAVFPDLEINWSPNNAPVGAMSGETQAEANAAGRIGTSHWDGTALYILGKADVDTDEFDDHVIVHEWGHYFEGKLGRSDNPGGPHGPGQLKDPRLAMSEGWGNALSAMVWFPNTVYTDSNGAGQAQGFGFDLEDNVTFDPNPGWYSEASVQSILFDLFDDSGGSEAAFDNVQLGLGPIYDVEVGPQRTTPALTTLFSFISALKDLNPGAAADIDTLTQYRGVVVFPISDAFGSSEVNPDGNNGGSVDNLPVYRVLSVNTPFTVNLVAGPGNGLGQNRFFRFTGDGASHQVQIATATADDVDVLVGQAGEVLASATGSTGNETTGPFTAQNGVDYVVIVTSYGTTNLFQTTVTVLP